MKYLVTGAAGFIGFHLTYKLLERGIHIKTLDWMNSRAVLGQRFVYVIRIDFLLLGAYIRNEHTGHIVFKLGFHNFAILVSI